MDKIRKHFIFYGEVQGVGFRWNAMYIARKYSVSGWARNLYDGTVEMEAEGTPPDIAALLHFCPKFRTSILMRINSMRF